MAHGSPVVRFRCHYRLITLLKQQQRNLSITFLKQPKRNFSITFLKQPELNISITFLKNQNELFHHLFEKHLEK